MTDTTAQAAEPLPSVGATLKSLREAKNLSLNDIAAKMHLDSRLITAIEQDNFDSLPDPSYVRGYIRSYSKLVGTDADALVRLFEQHGGNFEPVIIPEIRHRSQTSSSDKPVKAFTWLVVLALVVLLLAWWQSHFIIETPILTSPQEQPASPEPEQPPPAAAPIAESSMPAMPQYRSTYVSDNLQEIAVMPPDSGYDEFTGTASQDTTAGLPAAEASTGSVIEQLPGALPPSFPATTDLSGAPPSGATAAMPATYSAGTADAAAVPVSMPETVYQTTGPDLIVLRLSADSWIEITDATNTKVFFNLGRAGDVFNVRGTAPFDVLLGFSQAVTVEYNGRPFDPAPYSRSGVARFMLGQQNQASGQ